MVGVVLVLAEAEEVRQSLRIGSRLQREVRDFGQLAVLIKEALGAVGVHKLVAPVGRAAGLDDDLDVVAPDAGGQLVDVRRGAAQTVRDNHVLRHRNGSGHRDIRIVEEGRQLQVVFRKLAVEAVQLVQSFVRAVCRVLRPGFTGQIRRHIGQVVLPAVLQIRRDKVDAHGPGLILADGRQRFDLLIPFVVNGRHLIDL